MHPVFIWRSSTPLRTTGAYPGIGNNCDYCDLRFEGSPEDVYSVAEASGSDFTRDFLAEIGSEVFKTGKQVYEEYPGYANCTRCGWWAKLIGSGNVGYGKISEGVLRSFNINDQELGLSEVRAHLSKRFSDIYALAPRRFEEVVGDVYKKWGYHVILTPTTRDGGADLICLEEASGNQLIVECKRYAQSRKVGIGALDRLLGVKIRTGSHSAHLVTSSEFTADAKAAWGQARSQSIDLHLVDAHELLHLLRAYSDPAVRLADIQSIFTDEQRQR